MGEGLIEKVALAIAICDVWGDHEPYDDDSPSARFLAREVAKITPHRILHARAALSLLTKPENISFEMCAALIVEGDGSTPAQAEAWLRTHPNQLFCNQKAIAAAIRAAIDS